MTTSTDRIEEIFQDARELQADALEMLAQGRIRNAAEKAWGAAKRATGALVLARTRRGAGADTGAQRWAPAAGIPGRSCAGSQPAVSLPQPAGISPRRVLLQRPLRPLGGH